MAYRTFDWLYKTQRHKTHLIQLLYQRKYQEKKIMGDIAMIFGIRF